MNKAERLQQLRESFKRVNDGTVASHTPRMQIQDVKESLALMESFSEHERDKKSFSEALTSDEQ